MSSEETSASAAYLTPNTDSDRRIQGNRHETNTGEIENRTTIDNKDTGVTIDPEQNRRQME